MSITDEQRQELKELVGKDKKEMDPRELTSKVKLSIKRKYEYSEWATFFEFACSNGRRLDAVAFNLYPSRNFKTIGFEIKSTRSDWKRELKDGEKADWFVQNCDKFYVVQGHKDVVKEKELPEGWGLLTMKAGGKLYETVESNPTKYQSKQEPDREFYVRGLKQAMKQRQKERYKKKAEFRRGKRKGKKEANVKDKLDTETRKLIEKGETLEQLEDFGLYLHHRTEKEVELIKMAKKFLQDLQRDGFNSIPKLTERLRDRADKIEEDFEDINKQIEEIKNAEG